MNWIYAIVGGVVFLIMWTLVLCKWRKRDVWQWLSIVFAVFVSVFLAFALDTWLVDTESRKDIRAEIARTQAFLKAELLHIKEKFQGMEPLRVTVASIEQVFELRMAACGSVPLREAASSGIFSSEEGCVSLYELADNIDTYGLFVQFAMQVTGVSSHSGDELGNRLKLAATNIEKARQTILSQCQQLLDGLEGSSIKPDSS